MELELGLAPPNAHAHRLVVDELSSSGGGGGGSARGKRGFPEAFQATTLPLFDDGSEEDGCRGRRKPVVGWPPVRPARRACGANYVKVKKEGDAIGRKLDLALHSSYDELAATLARMFPTNGDHHHHHQADEDTTDDHDRRRQPVVTYEDGDGDWMLVGDVPWDDFSRSVKRLKILG
ncbi:auxin-responsive protein IAA9-like [Oryza brachyantha]|uniref:Auxin-responsive protein n=1 Tax=Oryza brachyantha TaxID=4533 RepID=J3LI44_ORYBR|nr:auxin-responsive protein IAA9-like [Oryza brachyantha]